MKMDKKFRMIYIKIEWCCKCASHFMNWSWFKKQVMAPTGSSRKTGEAFLQWKEPSKVLGERTPVTGIATTGGARKKKQATSEKVIVDAPVDSHTGSESNSGSKRAAESESDRYIEPAMDDMTNRPPPPS